MPKTKESKPTPKAAPRVIFARKAKTTARQTHRAQRNKKPQKADIPKVKTIFLALILFIAFFLPGQNHYQTLNLAFVKPLVRKAPSSYPSLHDYPRALGKTAPPILSAESAVAIDVDSGVILFQKNPNEILKPASTTKIMTAVIALENYDPTAVVEVKSLLKEGAQMGLKVGDRLTTENLLKGMLINSGNDAAHAIADNFPGGVEKFIYSMNQKAKELSMYNTRFTNINGFDSPDHYTTSIDLARLAVYALKNPLFSTIVALSEDRVSDITGNRWFYLKNVNKLLGTVPGVRGIKTGFTQEAGECLVSSSIRNNREIVTVILKSKNRFGETAALLDWVFSNTSWEKPGSK